MYKATKLLLSRNFVQEKSSTKKSWVLVLAAHPDDEVLGCGGAVQRHKSFGDRVAVCILSDGSSTQYRGNKNKAKQKDTECKAANEILGVDCIFRFNFPDLKLDSVCLVDIVQGIEKVLKEIRPGVVYTHSELDPNQDHVRVAEATIIACRPIHSYIKRIYAYEVLSSSEWSPHLFSPNVFVDISPYLETKIKAFKKYLTEIRPYPHPRSSEGINILAQYRGLQSHQRAAEAFHLIYEYVR